MESNVMLWQFLLEILKGEKFYNIIRWTNSRGEFKLIDAEEVARMWGLRKNKTNMNYDKLSRALRYYYQKNIIQKVLGQKFVYRFVSIPWAGRDIEEDSPAYYYNVSLESLRDVDTTSCGYYLNRLMSSPTYASTESDDSAVPFSPTLPRAADSRGVVSSSGGYLTLPHSLAESETSFRCQFCSSPDFDLLDLIRKKSHTLVNNSNPSHREPCHRCRSRFGAALYRLLLPNYAPKQVVFERYRDSEVVEIVISR